MKILTKEFHKKFDILNLKYKLQGSSNAKIPLFILDGNSSGFSEAHLNTFSTDFNNLSQKENQIQVVFVPDYFEVRGNKEPRIVSKNSRVVKDFKECYVNSLRAVSYLPENLLAQITDKRLFALGYVETALWEQFSDYVEKLRGEIDTKFKKYERLVKEKLDLTITKQLKKVTDDSIYNVLDENDIYEFYFEENNIYIKVDDFTLVLKNATEIEKECDPTNSNIVNIEIYKIEKGYELHVLLGKFDSNSNYNYFYLTITFEDMYLIQNDN